MAETLRQNPGHLAEVQTLGGEPGITVSIYRGAITTALDRRQANAEKRVRLWTYEEWHSKGDD